MLFGNLWLSSADCRVKCTCVPSHRTCWRPWHVYGVGTFVGQVHEAHGLLRYTNDDGIQVDRDMEIYGTREGTFIYQARDAHWPGARSHKYVVSPWLWRTNLIMATAFLLYIIYKIILFVKSATLENLIWWSLLEIWVVSKMIQWIIPWWERYWRTMVSKCHSIIHHKIHEYNMRG